MKVIPTTLALLVFVFMTMSSVTAGGMESITLDIEGMTCRICARAVKKALSNVEGVKEVEVSFKEKEAHVKYEGGKGRVEEMIKAVEKVGFKAKESKED